MSTGSLCLAIGGLAGPAIAAPAFHSLLSMQGPAKPASRPIGTIKAVEGNTIILTTDAATELKVVVQSSTPLVRIEPGQTDLRRAVPVSLEDLQAGDRILVRGTPTEDGKTVAASAIVLMKHSDIEQKQQKEQEEWKRSIGGLVQAVDAAAGIVTISTRTAGAKPMTIHVSKETILRRYAPGSVKFSDAKPGTLDQIKPGDQLRARGKKDGGGEAFNAEEIVSGSFRNIAGTISSVDAGASQLTVNDLITRKPVVVKITAGSQLRRLPRSMAQMIATRLKRTRATGEQAQDRPEIARRSSDGSRTPQPDRGTEAGEPDMQQMLNQLPQGRLSDLNQRDAVMIVSTQEAPTGAVTAITLLSGIEPILTASPESRSSLLSGWGLSAPAAGGEGGTP